ncbi:hypothetical protein UFOVP253_3 [uncultured Caudovirales phage]|uniref:Macro domain containing protein n=1 Tax=uncultured Caudovirales phage TaxID=2100421 RepID=A0A6J5LDM0_9CAUD|nr:hypothetical protein UFOVP253_3 [uncultured Caudovirales phage]
MITTLAENEVFIAGTNMNGHHYGGAAAQAHRDFGLVWGIPEGLSGQTYAFPTLEREMTKRGTKALERSRDRLYETARALPEKTFLLTPVGMGIAGYSYDEIAPLFVNLPDNIKKVGWNQYADQSQEIINRKVREIEG